MILQTVTFAGVAHLATQDILADAHSTVARWQAEGELVAKIYSRRDDGALVGLYLWKSRARAEATHDADWAEAAFRRMGIRPQIDYADIFMIVDNRSGALHEWPLPEPAR